MAPDTVADIFKVSDNVNYGWLGQHAPQGPEAGKPHAKAPRITDLLPILRHHFEEQSQAPSETTKTLTKILSPFSIKPEWKIYFPPNH